jgi:hypothetical protein
LSVRTGDLMCADQALGLGGRREGGGPGGKEVTPGPSALT